MEILQILRVLKAVFAVFPTLEILEQILRLVLSGIERQRLANIKANLQRLNELGLGPGGFMAAGELVPLCMCIHKYK